MTTATMETLEPAASARYDGLNHIFVNGKWRRGRAGQEAEDRDPYTGEVLLQIPLADERDLDDAFRGAAAAQGEWEALLPRDRSAVIRRAAEVMEERQDAIVDWLMLALASGEALERCMGALGSGGRVAYPNGVEPEPKKRRGIDVNSYDAVAGVKEFQRLNRAVESANLKVVIAAQCPLEEAARAHERLAKGHVLGKVVLGVR